MFSEVARTNDSFFSLREPREQRETDTDIKPVANINKD